MDILPATSPLRATDARAALLAGGLSLGLLVGAWVFQYGLGYAPCVMCYWQRHAHKAVLGVALAVLAVRGVTGTGRGFPRWLGPTLLVSALMASVSLAMFHVGVEQGLWAGPQQCAADLGGEALSFGGDDPLAVLDQTFKGPSCADVPWRFLGLSMAGWNALVSLLGALGVVWVSVKGARA